VISFERALLEVLSRSVRDTAAMLDATEGPADGDPHEVQRPERRYLEAVSTPLGRLKIAPQKRPLSHSGATAAPDRAWSDTHRDDPNRLVLVENRVILRRRQNPVEGGIPGRGVRSVPAELGYSQGFPTGS